MYCEQTAPSQSDGQTDTRAALEAAESAASLTLRSCATVASDTTGRLVSVCDVTQAAVVNTEQG